MKVFILIAVLAVALTNAFVPLTKSQLGEFEGQGIADDSKCSICKLAVEKVEQILQKDRSEAKIKAALGKVCSTLPSQWTGQCQQFVSAHNAQLVKLLMQGLNPQQICTQLSLCSAPVLPEPVFVEFEGQGIADDSKCSICKLAVEKVEQILQKDRSEAKIKAALGKVCSTLPSQWTSQCQQFVSAHNAQLVKLLMQGLNPQQICTQLSLCSAPALPEPVFDDSEILDDSDEELDDELEFPLECQLCEAAVWGMQKLLGNPKVDHSITNVIAKTCKIVPKSIRAKCNRKIQQFGPKIFNMIVKHMGNKKSICRSVSMC